ncbi:MAG: hypothetical protein ETSY1_29960 [Candidatus Entotheonella factor]|uniref:Uncharacterized protein n=1 Tax=Entotheonella factor TaxID=1429438 RepID=W4LC78_ENTF1|nr:MAG: hypothetical protein ETSY1_29960 [Candidatus Entotheonella factor]
MDQELIAILHNKMNTTYQQCATERRKLDRIEHEVESDYSVLFEVEIHCDYIAGVATSSARRWRKEKDYIRQVAESNSIFASPVIVQWIIESSHDYPLYYAHLQSIECLRNAILQQC